MEGVKASMEGVKASMDAFTPSLGEAFESGISYAYYMRDELSSKVFEIPNTPIKFIMFSAQKPSRHAYPLPSATTGRPESRTGSGSTGRPPVERDLNWPITQLLSQIGSTFLVSGVWQAASSKQPAEGPPVGPISSATVLTGPNLVGGYPYVIPSNGDLFGHVTLLRLPSLVPLLLKIL